MGKKLSNKALKKLTTVFVLTSIVTGSLSSTAIVLAEEDTTVTSIGDGSETSDVSAIEETNLDAPNQISDLEESIDSTNEEVSSEEKPEISISNDSVQNYDEPVVDSLEDKSSTWSLSETTMNLYYDSNEHSLADLVSEIPDNMWANATSLHVEISSELTDADNNWLNTIDRSVIQADNLNLDFSPGSTFTVGNDLSILWCVSFTSNAKIFGNHALYNKPDEELLLEEVNLPNAEKFGNYAFSNTKLSKISLPNAVIFGNAAFSNVRSLTELSLPNATTFGNNAFTSFKMQRLELPKVTSFGSEFFLMADVQEIDFPVLTTIGSNAFSGNSGLTKASLPMLTSISSGFFGTNNGRAALTELEIGITDSELGKLGSTTAKIQTLTLTNTAKLENSSNVNGIKRFTALTNFKSNSESVGDDVLSSLSKLVSVEMPNAIDFGNNAFSGATSLRNIILPKAESFGENAFSKVAGLPELSLPVAKTFGENAFTEAGMGIIDLPSVETLPTNSFEDSTIGFVKVKNGSTINYESVFSNKGNLIGIVYADGPKTHSFKHGENLVISDSDRLYNTENLDDASWGVNWEKEGETVGTDEAFKVERASIEHSGEYTSEIWTKNVPTIASILNTNLGVHIVDVHEEIKMPNEITDGLVTVTYKDFKGTILAPTEEIQGAIGESFETENKKIEGWVLVKLPENSTGFFNEEVQFVEYIYEKEISTSNPIVTEDSPISQTDVMNNTIAENVGNTPVTSEKNNKAVAISQNQAYSQKDEISKNIASSENQKYPKTGEISKNTRLLGALSIIISIAFMGLLKKKKALD